MRPHRCLVFSQCFLKWELSHREIRGYSQEVTETLSPAVWMAAWGRGSELCVTQHSPPTASPWALPPFRLDVILRGRPELLQKQWDEIEFIFLWTVAMSHGKPKGVHRMKKFKKSWGDLRLMLIEFPWQRILNDVEQLLFLSECRENNFPRVFHWRPKGHSDSAVTSLRIK